MKLNQSLYSLFLALAAPAMVWAQDPKKQEPPSTVTEEIEVVRPYKPILAEAVKLRRSPNLEDVRTYKAKLNYSLTERRLETNSDIKKLQAQQLAEIQQKELLNNYVKLGVGNLSTIMAEAYVNMGRDEYLQAGAYLKHLSQSGKLDGQKSSQQQLSVFGRSIMDKNTVSGKLNFERNGMRYYGFNPDAVPLDFSPEKQAYTLIEGEGELVKNYTKDEGALLYAVKVNAYLLNDKFSAKENYLTLNTYLNKRINSLNLGLAGALEMGNTKDALQSVNNNLFRLNPYIKLQAKGVLITAGINFVQEFGSNSSTRIFPAVTADLTLVDDYFQIFGEVKGDVKRNSLKSFSDENPFLNQNILMENTIEKLSISGGIKGTGGPGFGYKAKFYINSIDNMPLFVNRPLDYNRFDVVYDIGRAKVTGVEAELSVQVSDALKWTGKLNIDDYKPATETNSWFKPGLRVSSDLRYVINPKMSLQASINIQDDSKAKLYSLTPGAEASVLNVKGFVDLGLGAEYKVNKQLAVFARANNMMNKDYSKYLFYPSYGFNIFGGLSYSF